MDEPTDCFLTKLKEQASTCEYRELRDEMISVVKILGNHSYRNVDSNMLTEVWVKYIISVSYESG